AVVERQRRDADAVQLIVVGRDRPPERCRLWGGGGPRLAVWWDDRERHVHCGAGQGPGLALGGRQDAVDRQAVERRVGAEPTRGAQQVRERLAFLQLVD